MEVWEDEWMGDGLNLAFNKSITDTLEVSFPSF